ncbi:hypothetical protein OKW23_000881 [Bacilli bacterium PM5-9]|nr:hypothetical protein [Bacilli bacterium PM5-9]
MDIVNIVAIVISAITSIVAVVIAVLSILQNSKQLKESNKQFLFNERVNGLIIAKMLIESFKNTELNINNKDKYHFNVFLSRYYIFTNNTYLENIQSIITLDVVDCQHFNGQLL